MNWPADYIDKVLHGDCLEVMRGMPDGCVDLVVTDPPYGLRFMGKDWDKALPSVEIWKECLRTLKPGAFGFVMCIPRQDCLSRMILNLEEAGFVVNFTPLYHTFATGFPKSGNISKLVDKRMGAEREVVGKYDSRSRYDDFCRLSSGNNGNIFHNQRYGQTDITAPATPEAKALDGSYAGYQPKPAVEVALTVMKPLSEKTYLDQALANGKGITWLDDGRIPWKEGQSPSDNRWGGDIGRGERVHNWMKKEHSPPYTDPQQGRFAPNLLVSGDVLNDGTVRKSGGGLTVNHATMGYRGSDVDSSFNGISDSGSYSRYFSLDAWSEKHLPESVNKVFPFLIVPKASKSEKNAGLDEGGNTHATVKPVKLMSYLMTIGSRPGDAILDPFAGSGSTGVAAAIQDRHYVLVELDPEYVNIAERRIAWHVEERIRPEQAQLKLF